MPMCRMFFFSSRRRHTRFDCDWSSDVCSSDLALVAVVDGLGHGAEAAGAALAAVTCLERAARQPVISLIQSCHGRLAATRGAVMSVAAFNVREEPMTRVGVGTVEGVLLRPHSTVSPRREALRLHAGGVAVHLPARFAPRLPLVR